MTQFEASLLEKLGKIIDKLEGIELALTPVQAPVEFVSTQTPEETLKQFSEKWETMRESEPASPDVMDQLKQAGEKLGMLQGMLSQLSNLKPEQQVTDGEKTDVK